jgi:hypothetical protein
MLPSVDEVAAIVRNHFEVLFGCVGGPRRIFELPNILRVFERHLIGRRFSRVAGRRSDDQTTLGVELVQNFGVVAAPVRD